MPLKHSTESVYVAVLGIMTVLTGIAVALLPALPTGLVYFGILLVITLLYPLVLIPTFRDNRADYEFRLLHWFPFGMVILWGVLQLLTKIMSAVVYLSRAFFSLWSLPLVFLGVLLLILFCLSVVRRKSARIAFLGTLFGVFLIGSILAASLDWNDTLTTALYRRPLLIADSSSSSSESSGTGTVVSSSSSVKTSSSSVKSVVAVASSRASSSAVSSRAASSVASSRASSVASASTSSASSVRSVVSSSSRARSSSSSVVKTSSSSSKAPTLPQSGPAEMMTIGVTLLGLYTAVLHKRNRR